MARAFLLARLGDAVLDGKLVAVSRDATSWSEHHQTLNGAELWPRWQLVFQGRSNRADRGFWAMVRQKFDATQVVFECKNYAGLGLDIRQRAVKTHSDHVAY